MPKAHGKKAGFWLTDAGATERNIGQFLNNVDFPQPVDTAETSTFGEDDKTYVVGLKSSTIRGQGFASFGANEIDHVMSGLRGGGASGTVVPTFKYAPQGSATGNIYYTGLMHVSNYNLSSPIGGAIPCSFDGQVTGAVTRGTF